MADHQLTCAGCGAQFTFNRRKKYCAPECRASRPVRSGRFENAACYQWHDCKVCGVAFQPKRAGRATTCGRECGLVWAKENSLADARRKAAKLRRMASLANDLRVRHVVRRSRCPACSKMFTANGSTYCSDKCRPSLAIPPCMTCGANMEWDRTEGRVPRNCQPCDKMSKSASRDRRRAEKRTDKAKRKAMIRGAIGSERVNPFDVFDRDGWRCQICRRKTPRALRGKNMPRSPELDHIVSIANGGSHTYSNTQCLCRECNGAKGADNYGQLNLFPKIQPGGEGAKAE